MTDTWMWLEGDIQHGPLTSEALIELWHHKEQVHSALPSTLGLLFA
jgi:hypothetical protein